MKISDLISNQLAGLDSYLENKKKEMEDDVDDNDDSLDMNANQNPSE